MEVSSSFIKYTPRNYIKKTFVKKSRPSGPIFLICFPRVCLVFLISSPPTFLVRRCFQELPCRAPNQAPCLYMFVGKHLDLFCLSFGSPLGSYLATCSGNGCFLKMCFTQVKLMFWAARAPKGHSKRITKVGLKIVYIVKRCFYHFGSPFWRRFASKMDPKIDARDPTIGDQKIRNGVS